MPKLPRKFGSPCITAFSDTCPFLPAAAPPLDLPTAVAAMASHGAHPYRAGLLTHSQFLDYIGKIDLWIAAGEAVVQYDDQPPQTAIETFKAASKGMASASCECMNTCRRSKAPCMVSACQTLCLRQQQL